MARRKVLHLSSAVFIGIFVYGCILQECNYHIIPEMTTINKTVSECDEKYLTFNCSFVFDIVARFQYGQLLPN
jgi:hypothetical protein